MRLALMLGGIAALYVAGASWSAGYPPEMAVVRGVLSFMAVSFIGYLAELVVVTAPAVASDEAGAENGPAAGSENAEAVADRSSSPDDAATTTQPALDGAADEETRQLQAA